MDEAAEAIISVPKARLDEFHRSGHGGEDESSPIRSIVLLYCIRLSRIGGSASLFLLIERNAPARGGRGFL